MGHILSNGGHGGVGDENKAGQDGGSHVMAAILDFSLQWGFSLASNRVI